MPHGMLKPADAAKMLGISVPTLRRSLVSTGKLREIKITTRRRFFERAAVEGLLRGEEATYAGA